MCCKYKQRANNFVDVRLFGRKHIWHGCGVQFCMRKARKIEKDNIIVVCTIVLCFMLTLAACVTFSGEGFIGVFFSNSNVKAESVFAVATGSYADIALARANADLIKNRGGAGYVVGKEEFEIVYSVYRSKEEAQKVCDNLGDNTVYVKEIEIAKGKFSWCDKGLRKTVNNALLYFDVAFEGLFSTAKNLAENKTEIKDANVQIEVLKAQIADIKSVFYKNTENCTQDEITQIKLALVTCEALLNNISTSGGVAKTASSIRYQLVQLVYCRQALMASI